MNMKYFMYRRLEITKNAGSFDVNEGRMLYNPGTLIGSLYLGNAVTKLAFLMLITRDVTY